MHREYINGYSDLVSKREGNRPREKSGDFTYCISLKRSLKHSFAPVWAGFIWCMVRFNGAVFWKKIINLLIPFIVVINQLDAQNLFYNKFISSLYMFRAPCAHRQEVKLVLYSLWYHHTYRWPSRASTCFELHVLIVRRSKLYYTASGIITPIGVMISEAV